MPTVTSIKVVAHGLPSRDQQLEQATRTLRAKATNCGILVTRHSFGTFTAALSATVQYGLIQELDLV